MIKTLEGKVPLRYNFCIIIIRGISMLTQEIRRQFLQYFKDRQHAIIASSPVVPHDDPHFFLPTPE